MTGHPKLFGAMMLLWALGAVLTQCHAAPAAALAYKRSFIAEGRLVWGLQAPIPVMAAQVQQESRWNAKACSIFACGLAQFTPSTAKWISGVYPNALAGANVFNPAWAMRALFRYDKSLYDQVDFAATDCDQWAFALSAYNGGLGWIDRDRALCFQADMGSGNRGACDRDTWFENVEDHTARSAAAAKENRHYPRVILTTQEPYASWGEEVACSIK